MSTRTSDGGARRRTGGTRERADRRQTDVTSDDDHRADVTSSGRRRADVTSGGRRQTPVTSDNRNRSDATSGGRRRAGRAGAGAHAAAPEQRTGTGLPERRPATDLPGRPCSIAAALHVVGERWALLAVREISLGNRRFGQIARNTGAPRDVLTARLRALEAAGVLTRHAYQEHPPRFEYRLTEAGRDLVPVLNALRSWGDHWLVDEPPMVVEHDCGHPLHVVARCAHCGEDLDPYDPSRYRLRSQAPGWTPAGPVA